jgi:Alkylmercury lyase
MTVHCSPQPTRRGPPIGSVRERQAGLPEPLRALHRRLLAGFLTYAGPPRTRCGGRPGRRARRRASLRDLPRVPPVPPRAPGDKRDAARVAWAAIKLSQVGQCPVSLDQLATHVGIEVAETARLLRLTWRERVDLRDGMVRLDVRPAGPRRYRVHAGGRPVGAGRGCSVDITPDRVERIDPPTAVVAVVNLDADLTLGLDRTDADVCAQQPFFASAHAASQWLADHPQGRLIPVRSFHAEARRLVDRLEATPNDANTAGGDRA